MNNKTSRIEGTDTPVEDTSGWTDENRKKAYQVTNLLSLLTGKRVVPKFLKKGKDGNYIEEETH